MLNTTTHIYIFELKLDAKPEIALAQIKKRGYYERFLHKGKPVILVGLSFSTKNSESHLECIHEII